MRPFLAALSIIIFCSCSSTNVTVSPALTAQGKSIWIQPLQLTQQNKKSKQDTDSICSCTAQSIEKAIVPYLQQKGFRVITSQDDSSRSIPPGVDYVLAGSGTVHVFGSSTFVDGLSYELKDKNTMGTLAVASFSGVSIRAERAGEKIGKALAGKMK